MILVKLLDMANDEDSGSAVRLNLNSYLSLSMIGIVVTVAIWLNSKFLDIESHFNIQAERDRTVQSEAAATLEKAKSEVLSQVKDFGVKLDKLDSRVGTLEIQYRTPSPDRWTSTDMFHWAVKLQRDNPSVKVPEPTHTNE